MSSRLRVRAVVALAACLAAAIIAGCAAGGRKGAPDFESMPADVRLLEIEAGGPAVEGAIAALGALLNDPSPLYRAQAAQLLGTWAAAGESYLVLPALNHKDVLVRGLAQAAYIENSAYGLAPLAAEGNVIEVPPVILGALAELGSQQGLVNLSDVITRQQAALRTHLDGSAETAVLAADILARIGDAGARRVLITLMESGDPRVVAKAVRGCARPEMGLGPTLLPAAFRGDVRVRRAIVAALLAQPDPRLKTMPLQGMSDPDETVRRNSIRALGNLGAAAPVDALAARLTGSGGEKAEVIRALGAIGKPAADVLRDYLRRTAVPDELQVTALLALAPSANRDDVAWISKRLQSPNKYVRAAAAAALGKISHPSAQAALITMTGDPEPLVRAAAARALGQIGTIYGAKHLLTMLDDPSPLVRSMAAWGIGAAGYVDGAGALVKLAKARPSTEATASRLGEYYGWPELAALDALGRLRAPQSATFLLEAIESKSWLTRATAAHALGVLGDSSKPILDALRKHLRDSTSIVRAQSLLSLKALGESSAATGSATASK